MATEDEGDRVVLTVGEALDLRDAVAAEMARRVLDEFVEPELDAPEQTRQLLMAMCATCAHTKASHPGTGLPASRRPPPTSRRTAPPHHVDHRTPRALGGSDDPSNLRTVCQAYNLKGRCE